MENILRERDAQRCNRLEVHSPGKLQELQEKVLEQARLTHENLTQLNSEPLKALHTLKFEKFGYHPVKGSEMNLIEQLNQTFHDLASFAAARILFERFPECDGLRLNMETDSGRDIESIPPNKVWVGGGGSIRGGESKKQQQTQKGG